MAGAQGQQTPEAQQVDVLLDKGVVQFALGNHSAAHSRWLEALELDPTNERAQDYLRTVGYGGESADPGFRDEQATEAMSAISEENLAAVGVGDAEDERVEELDLVEPIARAEPGERDAAGRRHDGLPAQQPPWPRETSCTSGRQWMLSSSATGMTGPCA